MFIFISAQWLKDQHLKHEPIEVPEYWKEIRNPIRRFYTAPLDLITKALTPAVVSCVYLKCVRNLTPHNLL